MNKDLKYRDCFQSRRQLLDQVCFQNKIHPALSTLITSFLPGPCQGEESLSVVLTPPGNRGSNFRVGNDYICFFKMAMRNRFRTGHDWRLTFIPVRDLPWSKKEIVIRFRSRSALFVSFTSWRVKKNEFVILDMFTELVILSLSFQSYMKSIPTTVADSEGGVTAIPSFDYMHSSDEWVFLLGKARCSPMYISDNSKFITVLNMEHCLKDGMSSCSWIQSYRVSEGGSFFPCVQSDKLWIWNSRLSYLPLKLFTKLYDPTKGDQKIKRVIDIAESPVCVLANAPVCEIGWSRMFIHDRWIYFASVQDPSYGEYGKIVQQMQVYSLEEGEHQDVVLHILEATVNFGTHFYLLETGKVMIVEYRDPNVVFTIYT